MFFRPNLESVDVNKIVRLVLLDLGGGFLLLLAFRRHGVVELVAIEFSNSNSRFGHTKLCGTSGTTEGSSKNIDQL